MIDVLVTVLAIALGAFVKGVTGTGLPVIAIPVMATFLGVERSVVIMAIPGIVSNTWMLWLYRRHLAETRDLPVLLGMGIAGAVVGTWLLKALDPRYLSLGLAGVIITYVVLFFARPDLKLAPELTRWLSWPVGALAGVAQGATGVSGPLLSTFLHGYRLERRAYVVSLVTLFEVYALAQLVSLIGLGMYTSGRLRDSLLALLPLSVLPLGMRIARRLRQRTFDYWVLTLLTATAVKMLHDALLRG